VRLRRGVSRFARTSSSFVDPETEWKTRVTSLQTSGSDASQTTTMSTAHETFEDEFGGIKRGRPADDAWGS